MNYVPQVWHDLPTTDTPISAARLGVMEAGIASANQQNATGLLASQNGIHYDGTDEGGALTALIATAASFGVTVRLDAGKTLSVGTTVTMVSGSRLDLNGATIKTLGSGATGLRAVSIIGVSDVTIFGGTIDGDKASYAGVTEQRHAIVISNSARVTLRDLKLVRAKGDGLYVGDQTAGFSSDIYMQNVVCDSNHRNGMSVSHVSGLTAVGCRFINSSGTNPQCGVDIEPNVTTMVCEYVKFIGCTFSGNVMSGFLVSLQALPTAHQGAIDLVGCYVFNNANHGVELKDTTDFTMTGGVIYNNTVNGVNMKAGYGTVNSGAVFEGVTSRLNGKEGFFADPGAQVVGLAITGCNFIDNSQASTNNYHGVYLNPAAGSADVAVMGCRFNGTSQRYGLRTASTLSNVSTGLNRYGTNGTGAFLFTDDAPSRIQLDRQVMKPPSGTTANRPSPGVVGIAHYFDTDLGLPIWSNGSVWKNAAGTTV